MEVPRESIGKYGIWGTRLKHGTSEEALTVMGDKINYSNVLKNKRLPFV